jgi:mRNA interferase HicA
MLKLRGCRFAEGKRHTKVMYKGRVTVIPRHPATEMKKGTVEAVLKALGLKGD